MDVEELKAQLEFQKKLIEVLEQDKSCLIIQNKQLTERIEELQEFIMETGKVFSGA